MLLAFLVLFECDREDNCETKEQHTSHNDNVEVLHDEFARTFNGSVEAVVDDCKVGIIVNVVPVIRQGILDLTSAADVVEFYGLDRAVGHADQCH